MRETETRILYRDTIYLQMLKLAMSMLGLFSCVCVCVSSGELVMWDLTRTGKQRWTLFGTSSEGQNHSRIIFNTSSVHLQDNRELLISTSMDREVGHLLVWHMNRKVSFFTPAACLLDRVLVTLHPAWLEIFGAQVGPRLTFAAVSALLFHKSKFVCNRIYLTIFKTKVL